LFKLQRCIFYKDVSWTKTEAAVLETTTTQAFTRLARKSFQRVLRGGGGGGDRSVVQDGVVDLSVTTSNVLVQDLVRTLNNSTVVLQQSTAK